MRGAVGGAHEDELYSAAVQSVAPGGVRAPIIPHVVPWTRRTELIVASVLAVGSAAFAIWLIRPFGVGPITYDAASCVVFFDRIVSGRHLETFVNTTPKPLLTLIYGVLHAVTNDWRPITFATIGAYSASVALASVLAGRAAGTIAAVFAGVAIACSSPLLVQVTWGHALPWALPFWLAAGLALTAERPRPALAGVALLLAALARVETFVLIAVATALVAWLAVRRRALPAEWPILLAWLALPVMLLHDSLLTGDPLNWASVSSLYAAGTRTRTPIALAVEMWRELAANPVLTALGVAGLVVLVRRRRYVLALGIAGVGAGIAVLMIVLAARGTQVLLTYLHPILLAAAFSAAFGVDASVRLARDRLASRQWPSVEAPVWAAPIITLLAVAAVAGVLGGSTGLLVGGVGVIRNQQALAAHSDALVPQIRTALGSVPTSVPPGSARSPLDPAAVVLIVPRSLQTRLAVDLGLSVGVVGAVVPDRPTPGLLHGGQVVYHDRAGDPGTPSVRRLEVTQPTDVDGVRLVPVSVDGSAGVWLLRTEAAAAGTP